jgi:hypothetical protein
VHDTVGTTQDALQSARLLFCTECRDFEELGVLLDERSITPADFADGHTGRPHDHEVEAVEVVVRGRVEADVCEDGPRPRSVAKRCRDVAESGAGCVSE